eukprot:6758058-Pyramimonas_sp.AAC.1
MDVASNETRRSMDVYSNETLVSVVRSLAVSADETPLSMDVPPNETLLSKSCPGMEFWELEDHEVAYSWLRAFKICQGMEFWEFEDHEVAY